MSRASRVLSTVATSLMVLVAIAVVGYLVVAPRLIGGATLTVLSGSMGPAIPVGSAVLIRPVEDLEAIAPGTVITFQRSPTERTLVTHRVVRFQPETTPPSYITKGDANPGEDTEPVPIGAIRGEVAAHVPYLGSMSQYLGGPRGPYLLIVAVALGVIAVQGRRIILALREPDDDATDEVEGPTEVATSRVAE